ncbi:MAG: hypothetical protein H6Q69_664 [Firmicutes bacterium]|nr:hypothetical protein [Bacillota bacterium]
MQVNTIDICSNLSPELRLLLLCSNIKNRDKNLDAINKLTSFKFDWSLFTHLAIHHRVYPQAYNYLSKIAYPVVPKNVISALAKLDQDNKSNTLRVVTESIRILRAMDQCGIRVIVLKGFPLAQQLYGDITLRTSRDLDLLISPEDIGETRKIIEMRGYIWSQSVAKITSVDLEKWMKLEKNFEYWHPKLGVSVEVHWRLDCRGMDLPMNIIENNLTSMKMFGQSINMLGKEELLLYLVIHGAIHAWFRVKWLLDIDVLIKKGEFSWAKVYQLADNFGVKSILNQTLFLVRELFETSLPKAVTNKVDADIQAQVLAIMGLRFITDSHFNTTKSIKEKIIFLCRQKNYEFRLNDGWRRQLSCIGRYFSPTNEDLELISLSGHLYFFYYIISPFTWFYRRTRNVMRNVLRGL